MASEVIKKSIIKKSDLPNVIGNEDTLTYDIRYRIISEDKNRTSHWSPISSITIDNTTDEVGFDPNDLVGTSIPHSVDVNKQAHTASISWTMPSLLITNPTETEKILQAQQAAMKEFDVYVQWETDNIWSDWIWVGRSNGTNYSISYPHGSGAPEHIKFRVQKVTINKQVFNAATYLVSASNNL